MNEYIFYLKGDRKGRSGGRICVSPSNLSSLGKLGDYEAAVIILFS